VQQLQQWTEAFVAACLAVTTAAAMRIKGTYCWSMLLQEPVFGGGCTLKQQRATSNH
jgi:hypothetical protein